MTNYFLGNQNQPLWSLNSEKGAFGEGSKLLRKALGKPVVEMKDLDRFSSDVTGLH